MIAFLKSKGGASIIIALIIMILLLTIGTSVLVAATVSSNSVTSLLTSKQLQYFARSVADTVTTSLVEVDGALGGYLVSVIEDNGNPAMAFTCTVSADPVMPDAFKNQVDVSLLNMEPLDIAASNVSYNTVTGDLQRVGKLTIHFTIYYGDGENDQVYNMSADYSYGPTGGTQPQWSLVKYYD